MCRITALLLGVCTLLSACIPPVEVRKSVDDTEVFAQSKKNKAPIWQTGLGVSVIEYIQTLDSARILVLLKQDQQVLSNGNIVLINKDTGNLIWRYQRILRPGDYSLVLKTEKHLIFRISDQNKNWLLALNIKTGREKWIKEFNSSSVHYLPMPKVNKLLIVERNSGSVNLSGFDPFTGQVKWKRSYTDNNKVPLPIVSSSNIWHFFNGVEKLSGNDGKGIWKNTSVNLDENSPAPQLQGNILYIQGTNNHLNGLSTNSGKTIFSKQVDAIYKINNIYPTNRRVYLRGIIRNKLTSLVESRVKKAVQKTVYRNFGYSGADGEDHILLVLSNKSGKLIWKSEEKEPSVSNIVEHKNELYHATASRLISLDIRNGKPRYTKFVTNAGRDYPVHIRLIDNNIVFLGEWIVAAFDYKTGKEIYSHGMDPVPDSRATMAGLDDTIEKLKKELGKNNKTSQNLAASLNQDSSRFQNMANHYHKLASKYKSMSYRSSGGVSDHFYWKSLTAQNQATIEDAFSSAYNSIAITVAIWEFNAEMEKAFEISNIKAAIADASLFRKAILGGFTRAENRDYYYRPHDNLNGFVGVSIVNLRTGKRKDLMLSPGYQDYGLWNLVDLEKGIIYHHGIGLDTKAHRYIEQTRGMNKFMIYGSYLIAQPVALP